MAQPNLRNIIALFGKVITSPPLVVEETWQPSDPSVPSIETELLMFNFVQYTDTTKVALTPFLRSQLGQYASLSIPLYVIVIISYAYL